MISIYFSKYANQNPTKFDYLYIDDEKEKLLTIENEEIIDLK